MSDVKYSVAIMPPPEVNLEVKKIKVALRNIVGNFSASRSESHITLFDFDADESKLENFSRKVQMVCNTVEPFPIRCLNFGDFYWNRTIYIALDEDATTRIAQFRKKLSAELKHGKYDQEVNFDSGKSPHITIARTLTEEQFKTAGKYFHKKPFDATFTCEAIALRKLVVEESFTQYQVIKTFSFAKQNLSLF